MSFLGAASTVLAGGTTTVQASGGSVAGINTGGTSWTGLQQTAYNATIDYGSASGGPSDFKLRQGDPSTQTGQQGTPTNNNVFSNSQTSAGGTTTTQGKGTVTNDPNSGNGAPTYYDATWQTTTDASSSAVSFGSGTYDPWAVYARDIMALGTGLNGTADLYYQATLFGGSRSLTGFNLSPGQTSSYDFSIGNTDINGPSLLDINVSSNGKFKAALNLQPKFSVYLLNPADATNASLTPYQRINGGIQLTSTAQLTSILNGYGLQNGSFNRNLDFGVLYSGFVLKTTDPNAIVFNWTTDNTATQAVPEPTSLAALGLGSLALLRRRSGRANRRPR